MVGWRCRTDALHCQPATATGNKNIFSFIVWVWVGWQTDGSQDRKLFLVSMCPACVWYSLFQLAWPHRLHLIPTFSQRVNAFGLPKMDKLRSNQISFWVWSRIEDSIWASVLPIFYIVFVGGAEPTSIKRSDALTWADRRNEASSQHHIDTTSQTVLDFIKANIQKIEPESCWQMNNRNERREGKEKRTNRMFNYFQFSSCIVVAKHFKWTRGKNHFHGQQEKP